MSLTNPNVWLAITKDSAGTDGVAINVGAYLLPPLGTIQYQSSFVPNGPISVPREHHTSEKFNSSIDEGFEENVAEKYWLLGRLNPHPNGRLVFVIATNRDGEGLTMRLVRPADEKVRRKLGRKISRYSKTTGGWLETLMRDGKSMSLMSVAKSIVSGAPRGRPIPPHATPISSQMRYTNKNTAMQVGNGSDMERILEQAGGSGVKKNHLKVQRSASSGKKKMWLTDVGSLQQLSTHHDKEQRVLEEVVSRKPNTGIFKISSANYTKAFQAAKLEAKGCDVQSKALAAACALLLFCPSVQIGAAEPVQRNICDVMLNFDLDEVCVICCLS
jgi:hypothetical protein